MKIHFSTIQNNYAEDYLNKEAFNWLNRQQKIYILENLGDIRIQDPDIYAKPRIEIYNNQEKHQQSIYFLANSDK